MMTYFGYHALQGDRGLIAWWNLRYEIDKADAQLAIVPAEKQALERRVALLRPQSLDTDMLAERAQLMLGGVQGDEKDVLRKIKLGQLHAAGITGNGMTSIAPKVRVMDSPFLFKSYGEVDHVYQTYQSDFAAAFAEGSTTAIRPPSA